MSNELDRCNLEDPKLVETVHIRSTHEAKDAGIRIKALFMLASVPRSM